MNNPVAIIGAGLGGLILARVLNPCLVNARDIQVRRKAASNFCDSQDQKNDAGKLRGRGGSSSNKGIEVDLDNIY